MAWPQVYTTHPHLIKISLDFDLELTVVVTTCVPATEALYVCTST